ncbi:LysE/ArgO family amino acid transporter [Salinicola sp. CPA57]|uniref:LysE/ArgO family amino acid transporter n=1 Tax=Salinicola sp. CPA57 TaxID=1949080 RepID=UPI001E3683F6|nr:LysE/ArgO family amino acid transporter [Salinicola sp. CPA57]
MMRIPSFEIAIVGTSIVHGLLIGASLIVAIGAQNAFVLRQGLRREHGWLVAGICAVCDLLLVAAGVAGLAPLITSSSTGLQLARWGGVIWLLWQAALAFRRAFRAQAINLQDKENGASIGVSSPDARSVVVATLGVTLLNPHVYLDTVVMLGIIGGQQSSPAGFVIGASAASLVWFFGLVGLAHWLAPRLRDPRWWQGIDIAVGLIMLAIAWQLAMRPL